MENPTCGTPGAGWEGTFTGGTLNILGKAFSTLAAGFYIVEGYLRVTWDKLYATNPQIQMGYFEALQKLWH